MKNLLRSFCILLLVAMQLSFTTTGNEITDCSMAHSGTFTYTDDQGDEVILAIDGESYKEYHKERKYTIESQIKWVNDCEANVTLIKATLPGFPHKAGTVMNIKVEKIDGNFVYYTGTVKGSSLKGSLKKQVPEGTYNK